jgi:hypothetical protein
MSIQGISGSGYVPIVGTSTSAPSGPVGPSFQSGPDAQAALSPRSSFLGKLKSLISSDPAAAKSFATDLASRMRSRAAEGGPHAARASVLADRLDKAVASGDLSSIFKGQGDKDTGGAAVTSAYAAMAATRSSW